MDAFKWTVAIALGWLFIGYWWNIFLHKLTYRAYKKKGIFVNGFAYNHDKFSYTVFWVATILWPISFIGGGAWAIITHLGELFDSIEANPEAKFSPNRLITKRHKAYVEKYGRGPSTW